MRDPRVVCVTGMVPSSDLRTRAQQYFDSRVWWSTFLTARIFTSEPVAGDSPLYPFRIGMYGTGANFAMRRSAVIEIGWFSELLGAGGPCRGGGEDQDMFIRVLRSGGYLAYESSAIVWHEGRITDADLQAQLQEYGRGILVSGLKWLVDPTMRNDVLRRLPRAVVYYLGFCARKATRIPSLVVARWRGPKLLQYPVVPPHSCRATGSGGARSPLMMRDRTEGLHEERDQRIGRSLHPGVGSSGRRSRAMPRIRRATISSYSRSKESPR